MTTAAERLRLLQSTIESDLTSCADEHTGSEELGRWFDSFIACPSFLDVKSTHSKASLTSPLHEIYSSISRVLRTDSCSNAPELLERLLICYLAKLVLGDQTPDLPRSHVKVDKQIVYYYRYDYLRHWLPGQAMKWFDNLGTDILDNIIQRYEETCDYYTQARYTFDQLHPYISQIARKTSSNLKAEHKSSEASVLWRWLYLIQFVGEHLGHFLINFPEHLFRRLGLHQLDDRFQKLTPRHYKRIERASARLSNDWGSNDGLLKHFYDAGRCPSEIQYISSWSEGLLSTLQLHLQNILDNPVQDGDYRRRHSNCAADYCHREYVSSKDYKQKHIEPGCNCDQKYPPPEPDIEKVKEIILQGDIPMIVAHRDQESRIELEVTIDEPPTRYIAISHVWSDGRGNPRDNSLLHCQINWLYDVCQLDKETPIWMDTLCIPADPDKKDQIYRPAAIQKLNEIYKHAEKTIVISKDISHVPVRSGIDFWLDVRTSQWARRCWTLQEGMFGGWRLFACFKDGAILNLLEHSKTWPPYLEYSAAYSWLPVFRGLLFETMDVQELGDIPGTISRILQELKWRKTSWTADVPVIFAGLFPMRLRDIAAMPWGTDCEEKRVELVFKRLGTFPVSALFSRVSRSKAPGKGWAPRSLQMPDLVDESLSQQTPIYLYLWKAEIKRWSQRGTVTQGEIFSGGLHFYADLVYFELPPGGPLPGHFRIKLRHRAKATMQDKSTYFIDVSVQEFFPYRQQDGDGRIAEVRDDMAPINKLASGTSHFAVLLAPYDRKTKTTTPRQEFEVDAAIVQFMDEADVADFNAYCAGDREEGVWNEFHHLFLDDYDPRLKCRRLRLRYRRPGKVQWPAFLPRGGFAPSEEVHDDRNSQSAERDMVEDFVSSGESDHQQLRGSIQDVVQESKAPGSVVFEGIHCGAAYPVVVA